MSSEPPLHDAVDQMFGTLQGPLTVSRMGSQYASKPPRSAPGRLSAASASGPKRKKATSTTVPIETTLRLRKELTKSSSEPTLLPKRFYVPKGQGVPHIPVPATAGVLGTGRLGKRAGSPPTEPSTALAVPVPFWHHHIPKPLTPTTTVPRTVTAGPIISNRVKKEGTAFIGRWPVGNNWHSLLTGQQKIEMPGLIPVEQTDAFVQWYQKRELEQLKEKFVCEDDGFPLVDHFPPPMDDLTLDDPALKASHRMSFTPAMAAKGWQKRPTREPKT